MTRDLEGKTALVSGATSDIGMAIVRALAEAGAHVHALGRRETRLQELVAGTDGQVSPHQLDLQQTEAVTTTLAVMGPVDVLVCNAAHPPEMAPLLQGGMPNLRAIMEVTFFSAAQLCLGVLPGMVDRRWGRIITISSLAASIGEAHGPAYCASKAALDGLVRNLAIDYSPRGVTVNTIEAGPIMTERFEKHGALKARRMQLAAAVRRMGEPADIAHAVRFLASPQSSFITGESFRVDGGLHLGNPLAAMYVREAKGEQDV